MDYELYIEENAADYRILVDVYCNYSFTAGRFWAAPADCWPDEEDFSIDFFQIRSVEIINETKKTLKKLLDYSEIQKFIKETFYNFKEVLENDENLKQEWIEYNG